MLAVCLMVSLCGARPALGSPNARDWPPLRFGCSLMCLGASASVGTSPLGSDDGSGTTTTTIDNSFLNTQRDISDCLGNSTELPGCGQAPKESGDRGGWMQYLTLTVMALGVGAIFWRVARAVRARDAALNATIK